MTNDAKPLTRGSTRSSVPFGLAATLCTAATLACGGGGPGVSGPEAQTLFADYSGVWVLDAATSDSIPARPAAREGGPDGRGGAGRDPFGGSDDPFGAGGGRGGGGMPPGGIAGGAGGRGGPAGGMRPTGRGGMDPEAMEAMRHTMSAAGQRPERITLELDDSTFTVVQSPGGRVAVPMKGDDVELGRSSWPIKAKVAWDDGQPRLERAFEHGGTIVDHFELVSRTRLVVTRKIEGGPRDDHELRFYFDRDAPAGSP